MINFGYTPVTAVDSCSLAGCSCVCPCSVIFLAFLLASGLLLVILSCALYYNWWPLFVSTLPARRLNCLCSRLQY